MPVISVITAAYAPSATYLPETAISVAAQHLPPGWSAEWIVQEDGPNPSLEPVVSSVGTCSYEVNGESLGIAATRNLALVRARGDVVRVLDHDDVLLPGALAATIQPFLDRPNIHWTFSAADELDASGRKVSAAAPLLVGPVPRGTLGAVTDAIDRWSTYCAGIGILTDTVRALGGWVASPRSEDVGLLTALAELADGYIDSEVHWLYRRHQAQTHVKPNWQARQGQSTQLVQQRLAAVRAAGLVFGGSDPLAGSLPAWRAGSSSRRAPASTGR